MAGTLNPAQPRPAAVPAYQGGQLVSLHDGLQSSFTVITEALTSVRFIKRHPPKPHLPDDLLDFLHNQPSLFRSSMDTTSSPCTLQSKVVLLQPHPAALFSGWPVW
jgi:hypothetical protein